MDEDDIDVPYFPNGEEGVPDVKEVRLRIFKRRQTQPYVSRLTLKVCIELGNIFCLVQIQFVRNPDLKS